MTGYLIRRFAYMLITFWLLTVVTFIIIRLPPGDYVDHVIAVAFDSGRNLTEDEIINLRAHYGLESAPIEQYFGWIRNFVTGNLGRSFGSYHQQELPVTMILAEVVPPTIMLSLITLVVVYVVAVPAGIWAATHQYRVSDYVIAITGFVGMATPNFMVALILMWFAHKSLGISAGGLFSPDLAFQPWSLERVWDMITHLFVPVIVVGTAGTAGLIRTMRALMLDELSKQYVLTARAKGVGEVRMLFRYPVRIALNPVISSVGYILPGLFGGATITAIVMSLPMTGSVLLSALFQQDMYTAASILMIEAGLVIVGTAFSDVLLVVADPRIRMERAAS